MGPSEKSYNIKQLGTWPYEKYEISLDPSFIDPRLGNILTNYYFPMDYSSGHDFKNTNTVNYDFANIPNDPDISGKTLLDITNNNTFYWNTTSLRTKYNDDLYNIFYAEIEDSLVGFVLHPTKMFLKPLSAQRTNNGWRLKTSAIMLSANPIYFQTNEDLVCAIDISKFYNETYQNKIEVCLPNNILINYGLSAIQKFVNRPIIQFTPTNNPVYYNTNLELSGCTIKADTTYITNTHEYIDKDGIFAEIGDIPLYNNSRRYYIFDSTIFVFDPVKDKNLQTFLMLQSALNINQPFDSTENCVLTSTINLNTTNFKYIVKNFTFDRNLVYAVSGKIGTFLGVRYVSDSPVFRNTNESVFSTLLKFENSSISNLFLNASSNNSGTDTTVWETKYPPHHYSYNLSFSDNNKYIEPNIASSLYFDLTSEIISQTSTTVTLSTYIFSEYGVLKMDLQTYGIYDKIKFELMPSDTQNNDFIYTSLSCFYGLTENYYNISASPWIPAVSGAIFKIQTGNINGDVVFDILPKLSTYSGFIDSFYKTNIRLYDQGNFLGNQQLFQVLIEEGSNYLDTTVSQLTSESAYPFRDLTNSYISWSFEPTNSDCDIYLLNTLLSSYTLVQPNSSILFDYDTFTARFSGYGPQTIITILSSQKYNEFCILSSNSSFFDYFSENRFVVGNYNELQNLNSIRTISLTAALPVDGKIYNIPIDTSIFWNWDYDGFSDTENQKITAIKQDGNVYTKGDFGLASNLSAIKFYIEPAKNNFFPTIHNLNVKVQSTTIEGLVTIELDEFPSEDIFNTDFYVYYRDILSKEILYTTNSKVLTRPLDYSSKYFFKSNDLILNQTQNTTLYWNVSDSLGYTSTLSGVSSFYYNISGARETIITLSAIESIVAGWISAHNIKQTLTIYSLPSAEFHKPLNFNIYSEFFWNSGKNLTISDTNNYTLSLSPTAYLNKISDTYGFWVSANKQNFDKYIYSVDTFKTSSIALLNIPYESYLEDITGLTVYLTAFGKEFPENNGLFYSMSGSNGLFTSAFNITARTIPFNTTTLSAFNLFQRSPKLVPYTSCTFNFSAAQTNIDIGSNLYVTIVQNISSTLLNTPTQPNGGTITYTLSSDYWTSEKTIAAIDGTYNIFRLSVGDPFVELTITDKEKISLYLTASASIDKNIPETTFNNYPSYVGNKNLWNTVSENVTSSHIETLYAYITSDRFELYISDYYQLTGNSISFQADSYFLYENNPITSFYIDYGDGVSESLSLNGTNSHYYNYNGSFIVTLSSLFQNGDVIYNTNIKPIRIYNEWPTYDQNDIRFINEKILKFHYNLSDISIQPNEFGNVDIYNTAITRLHKNLEYISANMKTINVEAPTDFYGWLGANSTYKSDGLRWHTPDYNSNYYLTYLTYATNDGSSYFTNIESFSEKDGNFIVLDNGKIRFFKSGKTLEESTFINYDDFAPNFKAINYMETDDTGKILYVLDTFSNKLHRVDLEIATISYIFDILDIGGFGSKSDPNKFSNPIKVVYKDSFVYVLDYNNSCIKKYTPELTWVYTYYSESFENNKIEDFDIHPDTGLLYTINSDNIIYIFDNDQLEYFTSFEVGSIIGYNTILDFRFDEAGEFFYIVTNNLVYKFTASGIYIGAFGSGYEKSLKVGTNKTIYISGQYFITKMYEIVQNFGIGDGLSEIKWKLDDILLNSNEFATDLNYNRSLQRMVSNIKQLRNTIDSKFVLVDEATSSGNVTYFAKSPIKISERPVFSNDIETDNVKIGINEYHIPQVFNREFEKIYTSLELLKSFFDIGTINASVENGCQGVFCWSWKAMSCYNLSLPVIKLCNINPITFVELEKSFGINYAPSKEWGNAKSSCCSNVKSPLEL